VVAGVAHHRGEDVEEEEVVVVEVLQGEAILGMKEVVVTMMAIMVVEIMSMTVITGHRHQHVVEEEEEADHHEVCHQEEDLEGLQEVDQCVVDQEEDLLGVGRQEGAGVELEVLLLLNVKQLITVLMPEVKENLAGVHLREVGAANL